MLSLIRYLKEKGVEVDVLVPGGGAIEKELVTLDVKYYKFKFYDNVYEQNNYFAWCKGIFKFILNILILFKVRKNIKLKEYTLIHTNSSVTVFGIMLSKMLNIKHVWHVREFGEMDYNLSFFPTNSSFSFFARKSDGIISISKAIFTSRIKRIIRKGNKPHSKIIYNGIYDEKYLTHNFIERNIFNKEEFIFSIVGAIIRNKQQLEAIKIIHELKNNGLKVKLFIVGDGDKEYLKNIEEFVNQNSLQENVELMGYLSDVKDIYRKTDVFLMCSKNEAFGRVTVEAMGNGIPVIAHKSAGTLEIIEDNVNGLFYRNNNEAVSKALKLLSDPSHYKKLSNAAHKTVKSKFTTEIYGSSYLKFIEEI
jgi:glycosyltransferase involved in cell wall biosynthesis